MDSVVDLPPGTPFPIFSTRTRPAFPNIRSVPVTLITEDEKNMPPNDKCVPGALAVMGGGPNCGT